MVKYTLKAFILFLLKMKDLNFARENSKSITRLFIYTIS